ncbi:MAG TPA: excinuclease ABC subunit UvrB [Bacteroidetes bacterium]|nr:excinuclease ABC subunit UvrB [Bacteroidota bacterium]
MSNKPLPEDFEPNKFYFVSDFEPSGDQPEAIEQLTAGVIRNDSHQVLLGVTGSGKTYTIAKVIANLNRPTLVLSHNKTLAAQLYGEFRSFFPHNAVEYFISYYDYYQPEAYLPTIDKYIEKDLAINQEIEKLRLRTTTALLSGRRDVLVVSSVSCLYGIGNPKDFHNNIIEIKVGDNFPRNNFLRYLVDSMYSRDDINFQHGKFRVKGDAVDVFLAYGDAAYKIIFFGDEIEEIFAIDPLNNNVIQKYDSVRIYPANIFMTTRDKLVSATKQIRLDLGKQIEFFISQGKKIEAKRIEDRVNYDLEMMLELGYCPGIENYSRYFDGRQTGSRPFCLLDYFPKDFLTIVDESHVTLPQIRGMHGGDYSRKRTLVDYGFRLPAAIDNRPLKFHEFEQMTPNTIYMSATPGDYEFQKTEGVVVEQIVRPTGLIDPPIEIRPTLNQIDDLMNEIQIVTSQKQRTLVTTLTKRMAEDLTLFLSRMKVKTQYIHSDVTAMKRVEIMEQLREGIIDVLVGVNLLREGLDLPEVALVAILDADKEGFLRSTRSLTQTAGRAARNLNGRVIMYADKITNSMEKTIEETNRRRAKQIAFNEKHNITPTQITKSRDSIFGKKEPSKKEYVYSQENEKDIVAADPVINYMDKHQLSKSIERAKKEMEKAAKKLDYANAKIYRDEMYMLQEIFDRKYGKD